MGTRQPDFERAPSIRSPIFWHFAGQLIPWLIVLVVYVTAATLVVRWDMVRKGEPLADFGLDLYGMYTQLFFEPTQPLPQAPIARVVFWLTPLLGAALLARGVLRVGGALFDVESRRKLWVKIMSDKMKDHIIVCGLGHVGIRVVESLRTLGKPVLAIEKNPNDSFAPEVEAFGFPVIYGDARREQLLLEAGIQRAKAIVCATDDDLTNLEVAIDAKRENPKIRVVMRIFDQRVAGKMRSALDVDETFSTSALSAPLVALQATYPGVLGVYRSSDKTLRVDLEIELPNAWRDRTVADCEDEIDGRVIAIRKHGKKESRRPKHDTKLEAGDVLTLDISADAMKKLPGGGSA